MGHDYADADAAVVIVVMWYVVLERGEVARYAAPRASDAWKQKHYTENKM